MKKNAKVNLKFITKLSILTALATVLTFVEFPLPFCPPFYKVDFSSTVILTGSFALGPFAGVVITVLKNIIKIIIRGTTTAFVGEYVDVIITVIYILPAAIIYHNSKSLKNAVIGMGVGIGAMAVCSAFINYYVFIPIYSRLAGLPLDIIIQAGADVNSKITSLFTLIMWGTVPFNLVKGVLCSLLTFLLYKRVSKILHV